jgi:hypothetical protein
LFQSTPFDIWHALLAPGIELFDETNNEGGILNLASRAGEVLAALAQDPTFCHTVSQPDPTSTDILDPDAPPPASALLVRHSILQRLWDKTAAAFSHSQLYNVAGAFLPALISNCGGIESDIRAFDRWARLCADVLLCLEPEDTCTFFGIDGSVCSGSWMQDWPADIRERAWDVIARHWITQLHHVSCDGALALVVAPFAQAQKDCWIFKHDSSSAWDQLLDYALDHTSDVGRERAAALDEVAQAMCAGGTRTGVTAALVDHLLGKLEAEEMREVPESLVTLVDEVLQESYGTNKVATTMAPDVAVFWLVRTLTKTLEACPGELFCDLLKGIESSVIIWVEDAAKACVNEHYSTDVRLVDPIFWS